MKKVFVVFMMLVIAVITGVNAVEVDAAGKIHYYEGTTILRNKDDLTYIDADEAFEYFDSFDDEDVYVHSDLMQTLCAEIDWCGYKRIHDYYGGCIYGRYEIHDDVIILDVIFVEF